MLSDTLKTETLQPHQQLEKHLIRQIKAIETVSDYTAILRDFYGFISPMEKHIAQHAAGHIPDMHKRRKSGSLIEDIQFFEDFIPQKEEVCPEDELPSINTAASSIGALYVFEGSTLGGEIITALIAKKLNISTEKGFSFFRSYDGDRMRMWQLFKNAMDEFGKKADEKEVVLSAQQTFTKMHNWLNKYESKK